MSKTKRPTLLQRLYARARRVLVKISWRLIFAAMLASLLQGDTPQASDPAALAPQHAVAAARGSHRLTR